MQITRYEYLQYFGAATDTMHLPRQAIDHSFNLLFLLGLYSTRLEGWHKTQDSASSTEEGSPKGLAFVCNAFFVDISYLLKALRVA